MVEEVTRQVFEKCEAGPSDRLEASVTNIIDSDSNFVLTQAVAFG